MKQQIKWNIPPGKIVIPRDMLDAGLTPLLSAILHSRGIHSADEAKNFLSSDDDYLQSSPALEDIDKAMQRIRMAAKNGETVAVFGDYDVDGITSTCLMTDFLRRNMNIECIPYIPDRIEEGYGLNREAIRTLSDQGVTLIITVDCGITAIEETEFARSLGIDMIITDHHECQEKLPCAVAVVDPKRHSDSDAGHLLAGVGVAFTLACAIDGEPKKILNEYADLVAVGTVADVMPLIGENRFVVRAGLKKLMENPRPGFAALLREVGMEPRRISATTVGFTLAPRLNAAGRLGCAFRAAALLMEENRQNAEQLATSLCDLNRSRQEMEHEIWLQAQQMLEKHPPNEPIVLVAENWHQGIVGIVASRLAETYSLPAVMICLDGDCGKGSCRSYGSFNLFEALAACSGYLESFGGHALAAGLNITRKNIPAFRRAFAEYYKENLPAEAPSIDLDLRIDDLSLLSLDCVRSLDMLEPCGNGNPRPRLCIIAAKLENVCAMGGGRHIRLSIIKGGHRLECIYFSHTEKELGLRPGCTVDIAFYPQVNEYRSRMSVQLILIDIRKYNPLPLCRRILAGELPQYGEAHEVLPSRRDFAVLWRRLKGLGGTVSGSLDDILHALNNTELNPGKLCACITVFEETGLLKIKRDNDIITITQPEAQGKADLTASSYLCSLAECAGV
ncbi:MAG: single-stranded-DNA-specific exonuclease RecJ [Oscillospiraceae bacterium]